VDQMLIEARILGPGVTGCVEDYTAALDAAGNGPYDGESTTMCFAEFRSEYGGELNAAAIRAVLDRCQDVSPLNTAAEIGYNRNENPLVCAPLAEQTVTERYTGPEFILLNRPLSGLPSTAEIVIEVPDGPYDFLTEGYC